MGVFKDLLTGFEGWLIISILGFIIVMMGYFFYMFIHKAMTEDKPNN
ncbi:MAG: hypothetical protein HOM11_12305 [Methylococcales bacterium]|jgi:uncharacterized membrane protein|nr:hypothetical protein [Methylococcales bacterium]MBT7444181.1 hypothetical protein [Methylococcales bacterium]